MIEVRITHEFVEWFTEEFSLITDEPLEVIQEIVGQLVMTGCLPESPLTAAAPDLLAALATSCGIAANHNLADDLDTLAHIISDEFPDIVDRLRVRGRVIRAAIARAGGGGRADLALS